MYTRDVHLALNTSIRCNRHVVTSRPAVHPGNHGGSMENPKHLVEAYLFLDRIHSYQYQVGLDRRLPNTTFGQIFRSLRVSNTCYNYKT